MDLASSSAVVIWGMTAVYNLARVSSEEAFSGFKMVYVPQVWSLVGSVWAVRVEWSMVKILESFFVLASLVVKGQGAAQGEVLTAGVGFDKALETRLSALR